MIGEIEQIEKRYGKKFKEMFSKSYYPLKSGRYPMFQFFKPKIRMENDKLNHEEDEELKSLFKRFEKVEKVLDQQISTGLVEDQRAIADQYEMVEGQMRLYINKIK